MFTVYYANLTYIEQFNIIKDFYIDNYNISDPNIILSEIFYEIPFYYGYRINMRGLVYDSNNNTLIIETLNKLGYPSVTVRKDNSIRTTTEHIHRLLALTFIPNTKGISINKLDVNHIDGNKLNYNLDNLEWNTRKENCDHAYRTGLRKDNKYVLCTNLKTNVTIEFYSIGQAAKYFNIGPSSIHLAINRSNDGGIYRGHKLQYKLGIKGSLIQ